MKRVLVALCAVGFACTAGAASPANVSKSRTDAAERILNAESEARQRELETRLKVMQSQSPQVQAEFAVMMEELDAGKDTQLPKGTTTPAQ